MKWGGIWAERPRLGASCFFCLLAKKISHQSAAPPLSLSAPYHAQKQILTSWSLPTLIRDMLSVTVTKVNRRFHHSLEVKSPALVITASGMAEMRIADKVCRKIKRYYKQLRDQGRYTCYHWEVHPGLGGEDEILIIAMYPPTIVEFYDNDNHLSVDAVVIPLCLDCRNYNNIGSLW